jgi:hypothetical protein
VGALAANVSGRELTQFASFERGYADRNSIGHPIHHAHSAITFGIDAGDRLALGAGRAIFPGQLRRYSVATQLRFGGGLLETLGGIISASLNAAEVRTKALATPPMSNEPSAIPPAKTRYLNRIFDFMGRHHRVAVTRNMMQ